MPTIGQRVRALRTARGISQARLAKLVGISQPALSMIERGDTATLRADTLDGLCRALGATTDMILRGTGNHAGNEAALLEAELLHVWRSLDCADRDTY